MVYSLQYMYTLDDLFWLKTATALSKYGRDINDALIYRVTTTY